MYTAATSVLCGVSYRTGPHHTVPHYTVPHHTVPPHGSSCHLGAARECVTRAIHMYNSETWSHTQPPTFSSTLLSSVSTRCFEIRFPWLVRLQADRDSDLRVWNLGCDHHHYYHYHCLYHFASHPMMSVAFFNQTFETGFNKFQAPSAARVAAARQSPGQTQRAGETDK